MSDTLDINDSASLDSNSLKLVSMFTKYFKMLQPIISNMDMYVTNLQNRLEVYKSGTQPLNTALQDLMALQSLNIVQTLEQGTDTYDTEYLIKHLEAFEHALSGNIIPMLEFCAEELTSFEGDALTQIGNLIRSIKPDFFFIAYGYDLVIEDGNIVDINYVRN